MEVYNGSVVDGIFLCKKNNEYYKLLEIIPDQPQKLGRFIRLNDRYCYTIPMEDMTFWL